MRCSRSIDQRVLNTLLSASGPLTASQIADAVYADDPCGGPLSAAHLVRLSIRRLRDFGHAIDVRIGRIGGYTLACKATSSSDVGTSPKADKRMKAIRRDYVRSMRSRGSSIEVIARHMCVAPKIVVADLKALGMGRPS